MKTGILNIASLFRTGGKPSAFKVIGSGHINDSYGIFTGASASPSFFLQRINHGIFKNIPGLTANILKVTEHISKELGSGKIRSSFRDLRLIPSLNGKYFLEDENGNFWRMFNYIPDSRSYDLVPGSDLAYEGGKAFGTFLKLTADLRAEELTETIRDFHNINTRLGAFGKVCREDPAGRCKGTKTEIDFVSARAESMHKIPDSGKEGSIPLRVTHNDTKFNNILFGAGNKAVCIVDLDTVMPGYMLYDFGDAIRTGANTGAEDEADLEKVGINLGLFEAYSRGYLEACGNILNKQEILLMAFSARFMTYLIGLRFLTDYLAGDVYYKTSFPSHNLQRARAQFRLLESMEENAMAMDRIISDLCS